jgi:hypothetical protein
MLGKPVLNCRWGRVYCCVCKVAYFLAYPFYSTTHPHLSTFCQISNSPSPAATQQYLSTETDKAMKNNIITKQEIIYVNLILLGLRLDIVAMKKQQLGSLCIVFYIGVGVNNIAVFSVVTEVQQFGSLCTVVKLLLSTIKLI